MTRTTLVTPNLWSKRLLALVLSAGAATNFVAAQTPSAPTSSAPALEAKTVSDWLMRMHEASKRRAYVGTYVVSSAAGLSSAKIWHVCDGAQQMERVEALTGAPRSTFRHNDQVITYLPSSKTAVTEKRESLGLFPNLLQSGDNNIAQFYSVKMDGKERVAGVQADVLQFAPKDKLRFGYRLWAEAQRGLVLKLQTLDAQGAVIEQAAFSELQLDAPVQMDKLSRLMNATEGYKVVSPDMAKTTPEAEGWQLKNAIAGFKPVNCLKRVMNQDAGVTKNAMQWVFSDGLASVSIFIEAYDPSRHNQEGIMTMGATHTLLQRQANQYWLTVMGEVPPATLRLFAQGLERKK
jgi:sigma-E factor negative regulatory protein RseB